MRRRVQDLDWLRLPAEDPSFAETADAILARLSRGDLARVVVDLCHNPGGDSRVLRPLVDGLALRRGGRALDVVVLIGPATYSPGPLNALQLRRRARGFGEVRAFELPPSGIGSDSSTKTFRMVSGDPPFVEPDRTVVTTFEEVHRERDPVLSAS